MKKTIPIRKFLLVFWVVLLLCRLYTVVPKVYHTTAEQLWKDFRRNQRFNNFKYSGATIYLSGIVDEKSGKNYVLFDFDEENQEYQNIVYVKMNNGILNLCPGEKIEVYGKYRHSSSSKGKTKIFLEQGEVVEASANH